MRRHPLAVLALCLAATQFAGCGGQTAYDLTTDTGTIYGTLTMPAHDTRPPVVLIIAGSGPTDRDGNGPGLDTDTYKMIAAALAQQGIASVRYDKRGIGASESALMSEETLRFDTYVDDAVAWVTRLRKDGRFASVAVAGHSEGSLIGMIAARKAGADAFVSLDGAGEPAAQLIAAQLRRNLARRPDLISASARILDSLSSGQTVLDVPAELLALFRPSVQPYMISWFRYDPRAEIAKLKIPVTIVQGGADTQVSTADAKALARASPGARLFIVPGMSHTLKQVGTSPAVQQSQAAYTDPALPLDPTVLKALSQTVKALH